MGQLILPKSGTVYLDTNPVIYSTERVEPYVSLMLPLWQSATTGSIQLVSSQLLLLEALIKLVRDGNSKLESIYRQLLTESEEFELYPIELSTLEKVIQIRAETGLKTPDAIHSATVLINHCDLFLTNDAMFKRVPELKVAILDSFLL